MVMLWLSIALEIIENYGGLWYVCPYTRSYPFYLYMITSLREWFSCGRICGVASSRHSNRRGAASVRKNEETGFPCLFLLASTFQGEHDATRAVAVLDEHPGFPLLAILWLTFRRAMSPESEPKDQNDNGVK